jgi:site-specific DNA-cytosine methylase
MLARRGLTRVLGDIAALGYDAEWFTIRASDVGAPHRRERLFIIAHRGVDAAHADNDGASGQAGTEERWGGLQAEPYDDADAPDNGHNPAEASRKSGAVFGAGDNSCEQEGARWAQGDNLGDRRGGVWFKEFAVCADAPDSREKRVHGLWQGQVRRFPEFSWCEDIREVKDLFNRPDIPEPLVRGTNDGLPKGLDGFVRRERTKALGNAVVPAVAEVVAWRVLELEAKL